MVRVNEQSDEHSLNVCAVLGKRARSMVPTAASDDAQGDRLETDRLSLDDFEEPPEEDDL